jgi:hypothetical protein
VLPSSIAVQRRVNKKGIFFPYSLASAATGSSLAAFFAGKKPNTTPIKVEHTNAAIIDVVE